MVLNYAYPEIWDPHLAGTLGALAAISPMYNQVVEFNPLKPSEVIGDLATNWEVQDEGMIYVFHLHENVKWWDGHNLTAEDVAFSIHRMLEPGKPRPRVGLLRPMTKAAEAIDQHTVKVHLHYPAPSFLIDDPDDWVNAVYGPGARNYTRWKHPEFLKMFDQQSSELDRAKRWQILRQMEEFLFTVEDPYIQLLWAPSYYVVSDKVRTEAGPFVPAATLQVMLKHEHWWLDK